MPPLSRRLCIDLDTLKYLDIADTGPSAKLYEIGAGTSEIRRMVIGRAFNKEYAGDAA